MREEQGGPKILGIGVIHTPFENRADTPIQGKFAPDAEGEVIVDERFAEGLDDLDGFSHAYLIYGFHRSRGYALKIRPFLDKEKRGLFATRAPLRPNPIGVTIVEIKSIEGNRIKVLGVDMLDGTPLVDIKPYVPEFDHFEATEIGWLANDDIRDEDGNIRPPEPPTKQSCDEENEED